MSTDFHSLKIKSVEPLTRDSIAVTLDVPAELKEEFAYQSGQHLTFRTTVTGDDIRRSYSICRSEQDQTLEVGIKRIDQGIFSNFANDQFRPGMSVDVMAPQGFFTLELNSNQSKHYLMLAAGSGITPILSHISTILDKEPESEVTLIYSNKTTNRTMFRERISFLKNKYMQRLNWVKLFSQETLDADILNGRISAEKLLALHTAHIINLDTVNDVMICGPEPMIMDVKAFFEANSFNSDNVHYELFHSVSAEGASESHHEALEQRFGHEESRVTIRSSGRSLEFQLEKSGQTILDMALDEGADVPYACKGGVCATCKAVVVKGQVEMDNNHCLSDDEVEAGMILTCQAHPVSDEVVVDYDVI